MNHQVSICQPAKSRTGSGSTTEIANGSENGYIFEQEITALMEEAHGILLGTENNIGKLLGGDGAISSEQFGEGQVFIIQEGSPSDLTSKRSDIAVWNSEKGQYELVTSELTDFTTQIIEILEKDSQDGSSYATVEVPQGAATIDHEACAKLFQNSLGSGSVVRKSATETNGLITPCQIKREVVPTATSIHPDMLMEWTVTEIDSQDESFNISKHCNSSFANAEKAMTITIQNDSGFFDESGNGTVVEIKHENVSGGEGTETVTGCAKVIQLETATGRIIQLPGDQVQNREMPKNKEVLSISASDEEIEGSATDLPFPCNLCRKRFSRKLHLNNHMERHHGIKFVFTEKGRKVKLVRIPEGFKIVEGEKLDPCVEKLIKTIDRDKLHSIIGVEEIEPDENEQSQGASSTKSLAQIEQEEKEDRKRYTDFLNGKTKGSFGCGFLFRRIDYDAYKVAVNKGETPFAAFYPPGEEDKTYLFRLINAGEKQHLVIPATRRDIKNAMGVRKGGDASYTIPVVAALKITVTDDKVCKVTMEPLPDTKPTNVGILTFDKFLEYVRSCEIESLKPLASAIVTSPIRPQAPIVAEGAPKVRRKFQRRTTRSSADNKENKKPAANPLCTSSEVTTPLSRGNGKNNTRSRGITTAKLQRLRRNLQKEFEEMEEEDDDEEKDASYHPNENSGRGGGKKRGRGRPPGTKNKTRQRK